MIIQSKQCPTCKHSIRIEIKEEDYQKWKNGVLIQNAFPYLSEDQLERLITGYHDSCWDDLFPEEEEEEK